MFYKLLNKKEIKILSYRFFLSMRVVYAEYFSCLCKNERFCLQRILTHAKSNCVMRGSALSKKYIHMQKNPTHCKSIPNFLWLSVDRFVFFSHLQALLLSPILPKASKNDRSFPNKYHAQINDKFFFKFICFPVSNALSF